MKVIIFDSGTIINFAMNGLLNILRDLKNNFDGKFIITEAVTEEVINKPLHIKKFELEALMIKKLFDEGIFELPYSLVTKKEMFARRDSLFNMLNHVYYARSEFVHIVDKGEVSCLALSMLLKEKGIENVVAIDERTARMLCEAPENLTQLLRKKLQTNVDMKGDLSFLNEIKVIRSSELMYLAYKKGLIELKDKKVLDALLYASKFKGCSISFDEIEQIKHLENV